VLKRPRGWFGENGRKKKGKKTTFEETGKVGLTKRTQKAKVDKQ